MKSSTGPAKVSRIERISTGRAPNAPIAVERLDLVQALYGGIARAEFPSRLGTVDDHDRRSGDLRHKEVEHARGAVLRGDICTIVVREGSNIQDNSVLHAAPGHTLTVGPDATVGHSCTVHGRDVGERALIGNGSTLLDDSVVGPGTLVGAGSVVTPGTELPGGMVATGIPCKPLKPVEGTSSQLWIDSNAEYYRDLADRHRRTAAVTTAAGLDQ